MEFLINFDDSLLDEGVIYNFIDRLIKDLIKCTTPQPNGFQICCHTVKVALRNNQLSYSFSQSQQQCQCLSREANQNEQIIRLIYYLLGIGLDKTERINRAKQNIENPKLRSQFFGNLRDFQDSFSFYKIFKNNDPIVLNLQQIIDYADKNRFSNQLSFYIVEFKRFSLKVVNLCNGLMLNQEVNASKTFKGFQKLLKFFTRASQQRNLFFEPICIHNVCLGFEIDDDEIPGQIQGLQITQSICQECKLTDFCASIGHLLLQTMSFTDSSSALLNSQNLQLIEKIREGNIRPISFINELINPDYVDEVSETNLITELFKEIRPKSYIGREQVILEIEFYKSYFIKKTQEIVVKNCMDNGCLTDIKYFWFMFSLQLNTQLKRILRMMSNPQSAQLQNPEFLRKSIQDEIILNNAELERWNRDYNSSQDLIMRQLIYFYPDNMNDYTLNQFREILLPNDQIQQFDLKTQFRILCCIHLDRFFDYQVMLKTMKPYLIKTVYRYGIQVHEFERFIRDAHDQSEINVISEMISILRDFP